MKQGSIQTSSVQNPKNKNTVDYMLEGTPSIMTLMLAQPREIDNYIDIIVQFGEALNVRSSEHPIKIETAKILRSIGLLLKTCKFEPEIAQRLWEISEDHWGSQEAWMWDEKTISCFLNNLTGVAENGNVKPLLSGINLLKSAFHEPSSYYPNLTSQIVLALLKYCEQGQFKALKAVLEDRGSKEFGEYLRIFLSKDDKLRTYFLAWSRKPQDPEIKPWLLLLIALADGSNLEAQKNLSLDNRAVWKILAWCSAVLGEPRPLLRYHGFTELSALDVEDKDTLWHIASGNFYHVRSDVLKEAIPFSSHEMLLHRPRAGTPCVYWYVARSLSSSSHRNPFHQLFFGPIPDEVLDECYEEGGEICSLRELLALNQLLDRVIFYNTLAAVGESVLTKMKVKELCALAEKGNAVKCWQDLTEFLFMNQHSPWAAFKRIPRENPADPEQYERFCKAVAEYELSKAQAVDGIQPEKLRKHAWRAFKAALTVKIDDTRLALTRHIAYYFVRAKEFVRETDSSLDIESILERLHMHRQSPRASFHQLEELRWEWNDRQRKEILTFYRTTTETAKGVDFDTSEPSPEIPSAEIESRITLV